MSKAVFTNTKTGGFPSIGAYCVICGSEGDFTFAHYLGLEDWDFETFIPLEEIEWCELQT
jgi:hypothetical protein